MISNKRFDDLVEAFTRRVAQRTSRRSLLAKFGVVMTGSVLLPLLPVTRRCPTSTTSLPPARPTRAPWMTR